MRTFRGVKFLFLIITEFFSCADLNTFAQDGSSDFGTVHVGDEEIGYTVINLLGHKIRSCLKKSYSPNPFNIIDRYAFIQ